VEFIPHPNLYRAIYPDYDIRVPQKDLAGYVDILTKHFPEEREGIKGLVEDIQGLAQDVGRLRGARGQVDMSRFSQEFPHISRYSGKTWADMMDAHIKDARLRAIVSTLWGYYGLPPSKLSAFFYALPTLGYLEEGGYYVNGKSQNLSNALVKYIDERGGKVLLNTRVKQILTKDHAAYGVRSDDGREFFGRVVVSNANAYDTFHVMLPGDEYLKEYLARMDQFSVSLSSFQVFLGLKKDLVGSVGVRYTEIFY